jgi:hypothetical protein
MMSILMKVIWKMMNNLITCKIKCNSQVLRLRKIFLRIKSQLMITNLKLRTKFTNKSYKNQKHISYSVNNNMNKIYKKQLNWTMDSIS